MLRLLALMHVATLGAAYNLAGSAVPAAAARRALAPQMLQLTKPTNVDEAKKAFQAAYGRPVSGQVQLFVGEIIQGTCFAMFSPQYKYSPVYAVGFESLCKLFLDTLPSDQDREELRSSMCIGLGIDPAVMKKDGEELLANAKGMAEAELLESPDLKAIATAGNFKYTYSLGAGIICLMEAVGTEPTDEAITRWCDSLNLKGKLLLRDYTYYKSSVEKMGQAKEMMLQMRVASKKAEAKRLAAKAEAAAKEADAEEKAEVPAEKAEEPTAAE